MKGKQLKFVLLFVQKIAKLRSKQECEPSPRKKFVGFETGIYCVAAHNVGPSRQTNALPTKLYRLGSSKEEVPIFYFVSNIVMVSKKNSSSTFIFP